MPTFKERTNVEPTLKILKKFQPRIGITSEALAKMSQYIDQCQDEIGWLGTAFELNDNTYYIKDTFLFDQEVHSTTTEITPEGLEEFATSLLELGDEGIELWNNIKMWGHSHVNMDVFASGQDDSQMETFANSGQDWFIRLIGNKKGEIKVDFYDYNTGIIYNNVPWVEMLSQEELEVQRQIDTLYQKLDEMADERAKSYKTIIEEEIKAKVRKKVYTYKPYTNNNLSVVGDGKKNTASKVSNIQKTNTGKSGTTNLGGKVNDGYGYLSVSVWSVDPVFFTDKEVIKEFGMAELLDFATAETMEDLDDKLLDCGFYNYFHSKDLERIARVASKVAREGEKQI